MRFGDGFATPPIGEYHPRLDPAPARIDAEIGDLVEEAKLKAHDIQIALHMAQGRFPGCPHRHGYPEGPDRCDAMEMTVCCLELGEPCETFAEILEEWRLEYEASDKADAVRGLSESLQR